MKQPFAAAYISVFAKEKKSVFLTGDLGFMALEEIRSIMKERFINAGVAEQNMISVSAGMAEMGLVPFVYSIAPFITLKTVEQVRNDVGFTQLPVTIVGNGGGYGYGIMGPTHHALEDLALYSSLSYMTSYVPAFDEDIFPQLAIIKNEKKPSYLRLGLAKNHRFSLPKYTAVRHLKKGSGATVFALGPLIHEVLGVQVVDNNLYKKLDIWCVSELPARLPKQALISARKTNRILVIEEHAQIGGLGSHLARQLPHFTHLYAKGYQSKTYGNQQFHLNENGLDTAGIHKSLHNLLK
ncbi:MAG: transketolase [bacterium]